MKQSILTFMDKCIPDLVRADISSLHIKVMVNQTNLKICLLLMLLLYYNKNILSALMAYFATSHDKGCADDVGGLMECEAAKRVT